jgi:acetoin utilization deacetylase AcuC-like enzyme
MIDFDRDTKISDQTWNAALLACGCAIESIDRIMSGQYGNAFCATRPPGHHAGVFGCTIHTEEDRDPCAGPMTHGFCFLNNAAISAAYLKTCYRAEVKKVVIVDFDVHHGNGT